MVKQAPSVARILTMVLFALSCFGLLLFLWLSFGGPIPLKPQGYRFQVGMPEATQLGLEADVRVAGVPIGKVREKTLDVKGNRTLATVEVDPRYAPIRRDARAILRQKTLLGETYLELTPGTRAAGNLPEGGRLADAQVAPSVELDEIFTALDASTRRAFQAWQQDLSTSFRGHGQNLSDTFGNLPDLATSATSALRILDSEEAALSRVIRDTGSVFAAITRDESALQRLVLNSAQVFRATAAQNEKLAETFKVFPVFLDESRVTLERLRTFSLDTRPLLRDLRPVAQDLRPTLADLRGLAPDLKQTLLDLNPLIDASDEGLPALNETLRGTKPLLAATTPFLEELNPILEFIALYQHQTADFIGNAASGLADTAATGNNAPGHYLRQANVTGLEVLGFHEERLPNNRGNTYLGPTAIAQKRTLDTLIFPNWDCRNTGRGEMEREEPDPPGRPTGRPACFVQGGIHFDGDQNQDFPHITRNAYEDKGQNED